MCRSQAGIDLAGGGGASGGSSHGRELLPANVVPRHYDLTLEPNFDKLTFDGTVVIDVDVVDESTSIAVNTLELDIHSAKVSSGGQTVRCAASPRPRSVVVHAERVPADDACAQRFAQNLPR